MLYLRLAALLYWLGLTVLLLAPNPWALLGLSPFPIAGNGQGIHFVTFALLGFSVFVAGLPVRGWAMLAILCVYGVATDLFQHFIPHRMLDPHDVVANLLGLAVGTTLFLSGRKLLKWWHQRREPVRTNPAASDVHLHGADPAAALVATAETAQQRAANGYERVGT